LRRRFFPLFFSSFPPSPLLPSLSRYALRLRHDSQKAITTLSCDVGKILLLLSVPFFFVPSFSGSQMGRRNIDGESYMYTAFSTFFSFHSFFFPPFLSAVLRTKERRRKRRRNNKRPNYKDVGVCFLFSLLFFFFFSNFPVLVPEEVEKQRCRASLIFPFFFFLPFLFSFPLSSIGK